MTLLPIFVFFTYNTIFIIHKHIISKKMKDKLQSYIQSLSTKFIRFTKKIIYYKLYNKAIVTSNNNHKVIITTPTGLNIFYVLGITAYIKEHFDLTNYIFSGVSGGAWNSLFLAFKGDDSEFIDMILNSKYHNESSSVVKMENALTDLILNKYSQDDFELNKLNIGVSILTWFKFNLKIYTGFSSLEDAINCCIASSHIPFISGELLHYYQNNWCFDGGLFTYPYVNNTPILVIHPLLWNSSYISTNFIDEILQMTTLKLDVTELYIQGYNDTKKNHDHLHRLKRK